ncbi:hypothetical protein GRF61_14060 [Azoarcus sp. TTM-91]|uniref:hypothetical protein n=1 Tax=Azoarcus sp. TTM-91 TaxID=2691581 RepID=UPI00145C5420|nr:hypothetical protein [Azoarcus sp. TTM-91]NMG35569.1 hypothetical protein [Azoarcus sp. TTM-91]
MKRNHKTFGISDIEWFRRSIEEAHRDPVGMWQMIKAGRDGFGLDGLFLEEFVRDFIVEMIKGGAFPVIGNKASPFGWSPVPKYGGDPEEIADALIKDWKSSKTDPDVDGVWFAAQSVWK